MIYNLFLDDIRHPATAANYMHPDLAILLRKKKWEIVRNYEEFTKHITRFGIPEWVAFDHDLAEVHYDPDIKKESFQYYPETGYDCMKWMCRYIMDNNLEPPEIIVHSQNAVGAQNIQKYFDNFKKHYKWTSSNESDTPTDK